ncbi:hypothetical protein HHI36_014826 [Cryptolaemus montrouzieri]|uniref:Uncharacterized protein n=1 Tax=Cryptolaemus montrouzieri TaxID=559131 RepID=A0ABD2N3W3_9CUCU
MENNLPKTGSRSALAFGASLRNLSEICSMGKDNVTADALSRIEISPRELKEMNAKIESSAYVVTRGQARKKLEQSKGYAKVAPYGAGLDHPGIVLHLKPPVDSVKFRPVCELMEYVKENDNVTENALSLIEISSTELKKMNAKIESSACVVTRGQARKKLEQSEGYAKVAPNDAGLDQPGIVQLLKPPVDSVEL